MAKEKKKLGTKGGIGCLAVILIVIAIVFASCMASGGSDEPSSDQTASVEQSDAEKQEWADKQYKRWLDSMGVESSTEILSDDSANLFGYLNSASAFSVGDLLLNAQVTANETSKEELTGKARAVFAMIGREDDSVDTVQIVTADQELHVIVRRDQVPMLNQ